MDLPPTADDLIRMMADWLVDTLGYPLDMSTHPPIPEPFRVAVEDRWIANERSSLSALGRPLLVTPEDEEGIRFSVREDGGWLPEP